jgi:hypothetical protein
VSLAVRRGLGSTADPEEAFSGHDEEEFRSFVQCLRQFKANEDNANLGRIHNIIQQNCPDENLKAWAAHARSFWFNTWHSNALSYTVGGEQITVEKAFESILYSGITHTDLELWRRMSSLPTGAKATYYFIVQRSIPDLFRAIHVVDSVIYHWIDSPGEDVPVCPNGNA